MAEPKPLRAKATKYGGMVVKMDRRTHNWFMNHPDAPSPIEHCRYCGLYFKPEFGHICGRAIDTLKIKEGSDN